MALSSSPIFLPQVRVLQLWVLCPGCVGSSSGVRVREEPGGIFITLPTHCRWGLLLKSQGHQRAVLWPVLSFRSRPGFPELELLGAGWQRGLVELQGGVG